MKLITSTVGMDLPMPDGRKLPAKGRITATDAVAASDRVQGWASSGAVVIAEHATSELPNSDAVSEGAVSRVSPDPKPDPGQAGKAMRLRMQDSGI